MFWGREGVDSDGPLNKGVGSRVRGDECGSGETHVPGEEPMEARAGRRKADSGTGEKGLDLGQKRLKSPGFLQRDQKGPGGDKFAAQAQAQGGRKGPQGTRYRTSHQDTLRGRQVPASVPEPP